MPCGPNESCACFIQSPTSEEGGCVILAVLVSTNDGLYHGELNFNLPMQIPAVNDIKLSRDEATDYSR